MNRYQVFLWAILICIPIILAGCFKGEQSMEETDPPPENAEEMDDEEFNSEDMEENMENNSTEAVDEEGDMEEDSEADTSDSSEETMERTLYLMDSDGMIAPQTLDLPSTDTQEVATQALEYLVKDGPVTELLPNGFQGVLPEGTEILGLDPEEDGTMIVDVSPEFENYDAENERKILEAMTYTLTEFEDIDSMKIWINGYPQETMPVDGTPIGDGYSRANGINLSEDDTTDFINSEAVTFFYPSVHNDHEYMVPVTQHVPGDEDIYTSMVEALMDGPSYALDVNHVFNAGTSLETEPTLENGTLQMEFNKDILKDEAEGVIADEVMEVLVLSLTGNEAIDAVEINVEDTNRLNNEDGEIYEEPVTKEDFVPTGKM